VIPLPVTKRPTCGLAFFYARFSPNQRDMSDLRPLILLGLWPAGLQRVQGALGHLVVASDDLITRN
ncbi:MAG TPA: hypothetical protein PLC55_08265, partial [Zoogloea sp.]|nr:hypothetical protein [Zoogloea sp.]